MQVTIHTRPEGQLQGVGTNFFLFPEAVVTYSNRVTPFTVHTDVGLGIISPNPCL